MIETGHTIRTVGFESASHPAAPVEVTTNRGLFARVEPAFFARPDRPSFTILMLVERGSGVHTIDFHQVRLVPGRMLRVDPHQVQSWDLDSDVELTIAMSARTRRSTAAWVPDDEPARDLGPGSSRLASSLVDGLRVEQERFRGDEPSARPLSSMFEALDALFDRARSGRQAHELPAPYVAFRHALEEDLARRHTVRHHAIALGYSERTLSRACLEATGRTAKGVLTDRLVLEAKRQLTHTDLSASAIARQLGFSEATNFHRFFRRETGVSPGTFRRGP